MKILAIIGSPKGKGSGYEVVRMAEDRMKAIGSEFIVVMMTKKMKDRGPGSILWPGGHPNG